MFLQVDLLSAYSNRHDQIEGMEDVLCRIAANDQSGLPGQLPPGQPSRSRSVADRLSPADIESLVTRYRSGVKLKRLADDYGISISTVKRVLRKHGARRRPIRGEVGPEDAV
ncbi:helix-turn-helix domain-containing protein [Thermopolyspora sp. NPDC052614]|uniref:helix-turn-helix domain-containing protein n=1 Tax=Thermopolyspora sp. NPDC052614 TaxID=3155682 RepID=UPI003434333C